MTYPSAMLVFLPKDPAKNPKRCIGCDLSFDLEEPTDLHFYKEKTKKQETKNRNESFFTIEDHQLKETTFFPFSTPLMETSSIKKTQYIL